MKYSFECIDAHTCGNPVRVVKKGGPALAGISIRAKREHFLKEFDWIRTGLMFEPRGHDMMSGSILYQPEDPANDVAVLFIETSGCLPMCGHGSIGTITIAIQEKLITPKTPGKVMMETAAGLVEASYEMKGDKVASVKLINVPSYLHQEGIEISHPSLGMLTVDVAYGGNFYAIVDIQENFSGIDNYSAGQLIDYSRELRKLINRSHQFIHPVNLGIQGCSHVLWSGQKKDDHSTARNAVFYGEKAIDRSPCGTGTSARMAQWYAKGKLKNGDEFIHESIIGSSFTGKVEEEVMVGSYKGIKPSISGWAKVYGYNTISIDKNDDPYAYGFSVI